MLDPNLKFSLVSYVIDLKQGVSIAKEYDKQFFFPMLLKCHQILHIMAKFGFVANNILMKIPILIFLKCMLGRVNQPRSWWIWYYKCLGDIK